MKVHEIDALISRFGSGTTLREIRQYVMGNRIHKCPKCHGNGYVEVEYNAYPSGLPDSGFAVDMRIKHEPCELCDAHGYTEKELKPKMVQHGWESAP